MSDRFALERTFLTVDDALQYLRLPLRPVIDDLRLAIARLLRRLHFGQLDIRHPLGALGPAADQLLYLPVDRVNVGTHFVQVAIVTVIRHGLPRCVAQSPA